MLAYLSFFWLYYNYLFIHFDRNYAAFSGWFITAVIILSAILMQGSRNGNDLWLSYWVDTTERSQTEYSTFFYLVLKEKI